MSKHTPGPWECIKALHAESWDIYASDPSEHARKGELCRIAKGLGSEANARLIAAAPEMLALLERAEDIIVTADWDRVRDAEPTLDAIHDLLRRIRGEDR